MKKEMKKLNDETGVTLVELLAAIAILSIIVTAFLAFFIQAAKTNQHTNKINEATFLAQEQMEEVIHLSEAQSAESIRNLLKEKSDKDGKEIITYKNEYKIITRITDPAEGENTSLYKVVVTVGEGDKTYAQMETRLPFKAENTENKNTE